MDKLNSAELAQRLAEVGLRVEHIELDGTLHRCSTTDKPGKKNGAYIAHGDAPVTIWWKNWATDEEGTITATNREKWTQAERQAFAARVEKLKAQREAETQQRHREAAERARFVWGQCIPIEGSDHPYLRAKGATAHGLRRSTYKGANDLVIPVLDEAGKVQSLQFVAPDGAKRLLTGGKKQGGYFAIPAADKRIDGPLCIAEGYATAASVHDATGFAALVAFDAGNLEAVAIMARAKYPQREIVLAADYDEPSDKVPTPGGIGVAKATEVAQAVGGTLAIPRRNGCTSLDWNDLHQKMGADEVRAQFQTRAKPEQQANPRQWAEPIPFDDFNLPAPPAGALPPVLAEFCTTLAEALQVPLELPVAMSLAAVAIAAQGRYVVQVGTDYTEEMSLYILCPLEPGNRKSSCVAACAKPLVEYEREARESRRETVERQRSERATMEKLLERKRTDASKAKTPEKLRELMGEIADFEAEMPTVETLPRLLVDNVTPEALAPIMKENGERMGLLEAEGGIFQILGGMYTRGIPNLDLFLKAHDAESVRVDRKTQSEPTILRHPRLSIGLAPQPYMLTEGEGRRAFRQRGLDARFLYFVPRSPLGHRNIDPTPQPPVVQERYRAMLYAILATEEPRDNYGAPEPYRLHLEPAARAVWLEFAGNVERELDGGELEGMKDWAGKLPGAVARLAGILHVAGEQRPHTTPIDKDTMERAIALGVVFTQHSRAAYAMMGADPATEGAKRVLKWITSSRIETFTTQECWQAVRWSFHKMNPLKVALALLAERGYIAEIAQPVTVAKGGRPAAPVYTVNPATHRR